MIHLAIESYDRNLSGCVDDSFGSSIPCGLFEVSNTLDAKNVAATGYQRRNQLHLLQSDDPLDKRPRFKFAILIIRRLGTGLDQFVQNIRCHSRQSAEDFPWSLININSSWQNSRLYCRKFVHDRW